MGDPGETELVAHLRCAACKKRWRVRESDPVKRRHCDCGSWAPLLLVRATIERRRP